MKVELEIVRAHVLMDLGPDTVTLTTTMPTPFPDLHEQKLFLKFETASGTGVDYVRQHFGLEATVTKLSGR